jgi:monoamine oxidase
LRQAGLIATVYESSRRVGGRVFTDSAQYRPLVAELGGEFIDSEHLTMQALAQEFGLTLDDRSALTQGVEKETYYLEGRRVAAETILEQFRDVAPVMRQQMDRIEQGDDQLLRSRLDHTSIKQWLNQHVPLTTHGELHRLLEVAYRGEYGREVHEQSSLNLLYLIGWDVPDPFRIFGKSDERFHLHAGNGAMIEALVKSLSQQIHADARLIRLSGQERGPYRLEFMASSGISHTVEADHVIVAIPFTKLRAVDLRNAAISKLKRQIVERLGYGTNAKLIGGFSERSWSTRYGSSGSATTTLAAQQSWDTSLGQPGPAGVLTVFLGGRAGVTSGEGTAEARFRDALNDLDRIWPGVSSAYVDGSALRMHWPSYPHTLGSYACYTTGQWSFWSHEGAREGNLHFCGEHTSEDFQGYMEGAAETGSRVAAEVLADYGIAPSRNHQAILSFYSELPNARSTGRICLNERRARVAERVNAALLNRVA